MRRAAVMVEENYVVGSVPILCHGVKDLDQHLVHGHALGSLLLRLNISHSDNPVRQVYYVPGRQQDFSSTHPRQIQGLK